LGVNTQDGQRVIVTGELDMSTAPAFAAAFTQFRGDITVDLSGVTFLDSSGIAALIRAHRHVERHHGTLCFHSALPAALRTLQFSSVDRYLHIDRDSAPATP
jgi:anti-anti-sigma factor